MEQLQKEKDHFDFMDIPQYIIDKFEEPLKNGIIDTVFFLETFDERYNYNKKHCFRKTIKTYEYRFKLLRKYGFALPSMELINEIKAMNKLVVSVGCGTAYLEAIMKKNGIKIIASDKMGKDYHDYCFHDPHMYVKEIEGVKITRKYPDAVIFNSWATLGSNWILRVAKEMLHGQVMIHIGEIGDGCTATVEFYEYLDKEFENIKEIRIPNYLGVHDYVGIFKKK